MFRHKKKQSTKKKKARVERRLRVKKSVAISNAFRSATWTTGAWQIGRRLARKLTARASNRNTPPGQDPSLAQRVESVATIDGLLAENLVLTPRCHSCRSVRGLLLMSPWMPDCRIFEQRRSAALCFFRVDPRPHLSVFETRDQHQHQRVQRNCELSHSISPSATASKFLPHPSLCA